MLLDCLLEHYCGELFATIVTNSNFSPTLSLTVSELKCVIKSFELQLCRGVCNSVALALVMKNNFGLLWTARLKEKVFFKLNFCDGGDVDLFKKDEIYQIKLKEVLIEF